MWTIPIEKVLPTLPPGRYWVSTGKPYMRGAVKVYPRIPALMEWDGQEWKGDRPHHVQLEAEQVNQYTEWRV